MALNTAESYTSNRLEETVRWHGSECRRAHQPNRLEETVRWHGSECRRAHQPNRLEETVRWHGSECRRAYQPNRLVRDCEVAWLCGFTYYEKRIDYVRAEQRKKA